jgi:NADP-dependent 3-hydroxy acid dehydrogenase YdfG
MATLDGTVALVAGASSGIGEATALAERIVADGGRALLCQSDITRRRMGRSRNGSGW